MGVGCFKTIHYDRALFGDILSKIVTTKLHINVAAFGIWKGSISKDMNDILMFPYSFDSVQLVGNVIGINRFSERSDQLPGKHDSLNIRREEIREIVPYLLPF